MPFGIVKEKRIFYIKDDTSPTGQRGPYTRSEVGEMERLKKQGICGLINREALDRGTSPRPVTREKGK